jgi:uncharacterized membrane protein YidH (DUF202 family)
MTGSPPPPSGQSPSGQPPSGQPPSGPADPGDDLEERDPGPARERTTLAWIRTALAFAAVGGAMLKVNVITGLIILAVGPVVWQLGRVIRGGGQGADLPAIGATRLFVIAVSIVAVALLCMIVAIFGKSVPGALR